MFHQLNIDLESGESKPMYDVLIESQIRDPNPDSWIRFVDFRKKGILKNNCMKHGF